MKTIRTIIIDDERSARAELKRSLQHYSQFTVIAEASDADEAEELISRCKPDLLLLDIQMPGRSGFDLLESLIETPDVIFVTAYNQFAVKAFEVSAIDYLLKPVREERLAKALQEAELRIQKHKERFVFIRDGSKYYFKKWSEVMLIESSDPYVKLYLNHERPLLKTSLSHLELTLDPHLFFRANRSQLININYIRTIGSENGTLQVLLKDGTEIKFSERQSVVFKKNQKRL